MTKLTENVFAFEVPEDASNCRIGKTAILKNILYYHTKIAYFNGNKVTLPLGNWQFICTTKEATEEQAKGIVQIISNGKISGSPQYRRYDRDLAKEMPARCWTRDPRH